MSDKHDSAKITRDAWDANAGVWDETMGDEGNEFFRILCWPAVTDLLAVQPGQNILDIACGNGLTSRKLAGLGAKVTAFDFSTNLIDLARGRTTSGQVTYRVLDAADETALLDLGIGSFDCALSNMALFDIPEIEPLFRTLPRLLKPGGYFVFSLTHPAFNNPSSVHLAEEWDDGQIQSRYAVKVSRYMSPYEAPGLALRNQPEPHIYFHRSLDTYLNLGFVHGFSLDGFAERAFPPETPQHHPLSWGGSFSEIPPVLVARLRLKA